MEQNKQTATQNAVTVASQARVEDNVQEIDLIELFYALLHNWKALIVAFVVGMLVMASYHALFVKPTYRASTELYITSSDSVISLQDLQIGTQLTADYQAIITSRSVLNKVIDELQLNTDYRGLRSLISVSNPSGTHIISTNVTTNDVETSKNIANCLLNVSIERIFQIVGTSEPTIIDYSEAEAVINVTPSMVKYMAIGGFIGVLFISAFIILRILMDNTMKTDDDVEKYLQLPVLAAVPYYED